MGESVAHAARVCASLGSAAEVPNHLESPTPDSPLLIQAPAPPTTLRIRSGCSNEEMPNSSIVRHLFPLSTDFHENPALFSESFSAPQQFTRVPWQGTAGRSRGGESGSTPFDGGLELAGPAPGMNASFLKQVSMKTGFLNA